MSIILYVGVIHNHVIMQMVVYLQFQACVTLCIIFDVCCLECTVCILYVYRIYGYIPTKM